MRAARHDLVMETGAVLTKVFRVVLPAPGPAPVSGVVVGDRVYYKGDPLRVYIATPHPDPDPVRATVDLVFGTGAWYEPRVTLAADALVYKAQPANVISCEAGFTLLDDVTQTQIRVPLPVTIENANTIALTMDDSETAQFVDYEGAWSWDLYVATAEWDWRRTVEGTLNILRGSGRDL